MTREQIENGLYSYTRRLVTQEIRSLSVGKQVSVTIRDAERFAGEVFASTLSHLRIEIDIDEIIRPAARHAIEDHLVSLGLLPHSLATAAFRATTRRRQAQASDPAGQWHRPEIRPGFSSGMDSFFR